VISILLGLRHLHRVGWPEEGGRIRAHIVTAVCVAAVAVFLDGRSLSDLASGSFPTMNRNGVGWAAVAVLIGVACEYGLKGRRRPRPTLANGLGST